MKQLFIITHQNKSKVVPVEGTEEYAIQYISGYVQALRDKFGKLDKIDVKKAPNNTVN